jgi:hypothetical protein
VSCGGAGRRLGIAGTRPGKGGISRGRGDADLDLTGDTTEAALASKPERLPPGAPRPAPSQRIGVSRVDPTAAPVRDTAAGSAGDDGVGAAAWRRRIAPRHRDAVRLFFGTGAPPAPGTDAPLPATDGGK